jgi:hypothetical protein
MGTLNYLISQLIKITSHNRVTEIHEVVRIMRLIDKKKRNRKVKYFAAQFGFGKNYLKLKFLFFPH